jgi:hypothetical protein
VRTITAILAAVAARAITFTTGDARIATFAITTLAVIGTALAIGASSLARSAIRTSRTLAAIVTAIASRAHFIYTGITSTEAPAIAQANGTFAAISLSAISAVVTQVITVSVAVWAGFTGTIILFLSAVIASLD